MRRMKFFSSASLLPEMSYRLNERMPGWVRSQPNHVFRDLDDDEIINHMVDYFMLKPLNVVSQEVKSEQFVWQKCADEAHTRERVTVFVTFTGSPELWAMRVDGHTRDQPMAEFVHDNVVAFMATAKEGQAEKALKKVHKDLERAVACIEVQEEHLRGFEAALREKATSLVTRIRAARGVNFEPPRQIAAE